MRVPFERLLLTVGANAQDQVLLKASYGTKWFGHLTDSPDAPSYSFLGHHGELPDSLRAVSPFR